MVIFFFYTIIGYKVPKPNIPPEDITFKDIYGFIHQFEEISVELKAIYEAYIQGWTTLSNRVKVVRNLRDGRRILRKHILQVFKYVYSLFFFF